ncbi:MAG: hypothetical protein ACKOTF_08805, partial [Opitutaceae bacterium]
MTATGPSSRVWFITGCSGGLGRALAGAALVRGDRVVAASRRPEHHADLVAAHPETCRPVKARPDRRRIMGVEGDGAARFRMRGDEIGEFFRPPARGDHAVP